MQCINNLQEQQNNHLLDYLTLVANYCCVIPSGYLKSHTVQHHLLFLYDWPYSPLLMKSQLHSIKNLIALISDQCTLVNTDQTEFNCVIATQELKICRKDVTKDLGVIFNTSVCWNQHYRTIISQAYSQMSKMYIQNLWPCQLLSSKTFYIATTLVRANTLFPTLETHTYLKKSLYQKESNAMPQNSS